MELVPLTQGKFAIVDAADFARINKHNWCYIDSKKQRGGYARRRASKKLGEHGSMISMHYQVLNLKPRPGVTIDHKNNNTLDNRKRNLRLANAMQQAQNKRTRSDTKHARLKGVSRVRDRNGIPKYWVASVQFNGVRKHLGVFKTAQLAHRAYKKEARKLFGAFTCKKPNC